MTRNRILGALSILTALLVVGCGGSSSKKKTLDAAGFAERAADAVCTALANCGCASTPVDCKTAVTDQYTELLSRHQVQYPSQKLVPEKMQACLDDLAADLRDCSLQRWTGDVTAKGWWGHSTNFGYESTWLPESCFSVELYVGVQEKDERCFSSNDCAPGLYCDRDSFTCQPLTAAGAACGGEGDPDCVDGCYCPHEADSVCTQYPGEGEDCGFGDYECQEGLFCNESESGEPKYVCKAPGQAGDYCHSGSHGACRAGLFCDVSHECKPVLADGTDCTDGRACVHGWCQMKPDMEDCDTPGNCQCADPGVCDAVEGLQGTSGPFARPPT
jgi:hypothetical protein